MLTLFSLIPGVILAAYIRMCTTLTKPPAVLLFVYAVLAFLMSVVWISFGGDVVIDIIQTLGRVLDIEPSALGLTLVALGNCLGDMSADVAMTKKGFGEMAITATMAGPVFNLNVSLGLALTKVLLSQDDNWIAYSLFEDGKINRTVLIPIVLVLACILVQAGILYNGTRNSYWLHMSMHWPMLILYAVVVTSLVVYVLII